MVLCTACAWRDGVWLWWCGGGAWGEVVRWSPRPRRMGLSVRVCGPVGSTEEVVCLSLLNRSGLVYKYCILILHGLY